MIAPDPFQPLSRTHPPAEHAPRVLDIFCGAGGFSLGFSSAGFQIAAGVEVDTHAAYTFEHNVSYFQGRACRIYGGPERGDMRTLQPEEVLEEVGPCDVIVGGPPCKAFSRIGRGKLNSLSERGYLLDPRNRLYHNFHHFLEVFAPRAFVMENVTGMLSMEGRNVADVAARELSRPMGEDGVRYEVRYAVLDASWYGVPQYRQRVIFMGIRSDLGLRPSFPARQTTGSPSHTGYMRWPTEHEQQELFGGDLRKQFTLPVPSVPEPHAPVTVSEALDDLPRITDHLEGETPSSDWRETQEYRSELAPSRRSRLCPLDARVGWTLQRAIPGRKRSLHSPDPAGLRDLPGHGARRHLPRRPRAGHCPSRGTPPHATGPGTGPRRGGARAASRGDRASVSQ